MQENLISRVGIDRISFATSNYFLTLKELSKHTGEDPQKYFQGLMQEKMSVATPNEDIVTLGARAAKRIIDTDGDKQIGMLLVGTESGIDQSKSAGIYIHNLLGLDPRCRVVELKQACYGGTAGLMMACDYVRSNPDKSVLVIAADIARYERDTPAEPTQGCGAVAMLISRNPRIMTISKNSSAYCLDVMDFWRPNYRKEPFVDGKYSTSIYLDVLEETWNLYHQSSQEQINDYKGLLFHVPFCKMAKKALERIGEIQGINDLKHQQFLNVIHEAIKYNKQVGNCYTGSLYLSLVSLLDNSTQLLEKEKVGMFSYGSGCTAEFFVGTIEPDYQKYLYTNCHKQQLENRVELSYEQYVRIHDYQLEHACKTYVPVAQYNNNEFTLSGIDDHKRDYSIEHQGEFSCAG